jgi:hypothetical protein
MNRPVKYMNASPRHGFETHFAFALAEKKSRLEPSTNRISLTIYPGVGANRSAF